MIRYGNKVFAAEHIASAEFHEAEVRADEAFRPIQLSVRLRLTFVGGGQMELSGAAADRAWTMIKAMSLDLVAHKHEAEVNE